MVFCLLMYWSWVFWGMMFWSMVYVLLDVWSFGLWSFGPKRLKDSRPKDQRPNDQRLKDQKNRDQRHKTRFEGLRWVILSKDPYRNLGSQPLDLAHHEQTSVSQVSEWVRSRSLKGLGIPRNVGSAQVELRRFSECRVLVDCGRPGCYFFKTFIRLERESKALSTV